MIEQINFHSGREIIKILTPSSEEQRGCQVSMLLIENGKKIFDGLKENGIIGDWREPNVIRIAPVPLYNTYEDVYWFGSVLRKLFFQES
jgi:kynureninase